MKKHYNVVNLFVNTYNDLDSAPANITLIDISYCKNHSLTKGHEYFHSTILFDQISYFHGKYYKTPGELCKNSNVTQLQVGNITHIWNEGNCAQISSHFIADLNFRS